MRLTLRALRVNYGLTQTQLANTLGVSRYAIESYEIGRSIPNAENVRKIVNLFGVDINSIFFGSHLSLKDRISTGGNK